MSYSLTDTKWGEPTMGTDSGVIYYTIDLSGLTYDTSRYTEADLYAAAMDAFQAWEDVADIDFEPAPEGVEADINVITGLLEGSTVGAAWWTFYGWTDSMWEYSSARLTMDTEPTWSPYGETGTSLYAVMLHEIGHVIGLDHVDDTTEIMNPYLAADDLGDGDIAGAQEIYGDDTVVADLPPEEPAPEEPLPEEPLPEEPAPEEPLPEEPVKGNGKGNGHGPDKDGGGIGGGKGNGKKSATSELKAQPDEETSEDEDDAEDNGHPKGPDPKVVLLTDLLPVVEVADEHAPWFRDENDEEQELAFADLC